MRFASIWLWVTFTTVWPLHNQLVNLLASDSKEEPKAMSIRAGLSPTAYVCHMGCKTKLTDCKLWAEIDFGKQGWAGLVL